MASSTTSLQPHIRKREALAAQLRQGGGPVGLRKDTSNLFRDREAGARRRLDVRHFNEVIGFGDGWVEAEGMISYEDLVAACLARGVMPTVVPQLKTITLGGAVAGVGIESSSHRHGLVHDGMLELDVLLGDGSVVTCAPGNEHAGLFYGFPNSYGTLGYALRVKVKTVPVKPFVRLSHVKYTDGKSFFRGLEERLQSRSHDFIDGAVFSPQEMFLTLGTFAERAPYASDYTFEKIYYRSIREREEDFLTIHDYLWRWDTDWFWCSKNLMAQNPLVRKYVFGRENLGSRSYTKIMRWNSRVGLTKKLERVIGLHSESVIQDVDVPLENAADFLEFYGREIALWPQWICPIGSDSKKKFSLYPVRDAWYVNFGFWDVKRTRDAYPPGHFNRLVEREVARLGGIKSLYSDSFFPEDEFWRAYGGEAYRALKAKYDPAGAFPGLYDKCVLRR